MSHVVTPAALTIAPIVEVAGKRSHPRRLRRKLHWERGYRAYVLRDAKGRKHGRIDLAGSPPSYVWRTTAGMRGTARTLAAARAAVEQVLRRGMYQLDLFEPLSQSRRSI